MPTPGASVAGTPLRGGSVGPGATPGRTPVRDALGLNDPDALAPAEARMAPMSWQCPEFANMADEVAAPCFGQQPIRDAHS